jgi:DNA-directed RNA polymerase III subunit RPC1
MLSLGVALTLGMDSKKASFMIMISVIIDRSELVCGNVGKKVLGPSKAGLLYILNRDNSAEVAASVMLRIGKLASRFLINYGMTIGIGDVTPSKSLVEINRKEVMKGYEECSEAISKMERNQLERVPG